MTMSHPEMPDDLMPIKHKQRWYNSKNYILPTDDDEFVRRRITVLYNGLSDRLHDRLIIIYTQHRLQLQHNLIFRMFEDRLVICPLEIKSGDEVLDIGTGTAAWALDFIASYPGVLNNNLKLVCIDISSRLFPKSPPSNMFFEIENVLNLPADWTGRFAFVHQRLLIAALKRDEWERAVMEVFRVTMAGGWAQFCEANLSNMGGSGPAIARFMHLYSKLEKAVGIDFLCSLSIGQIMQRVGFVNVRTDKRVGQVGEWNGELGKRHKENIIGLFKGFKTPILRLGGLGLVKNEGEFDTLLEEVEEELTRPGSAYEFYIIMGQKPSY